MRNKIYFIGLIVMIVFSLGFQACSPDYETNFEKKVLQIKHRDLSPINFAVSGGSSEIPIETNVPVENLSASSNAEWCLVEKHRDKIVISASSNDLYVTKVARVTIAYGYQSYEILVSQKGLEPSILIDGEREGAEKEVSANGGKFVVDVESNLDLDYILVPELAKWIKLESVVEDGNNKKLVFDVLPSYFATDREAVISLQSDENNGYTSYFIIKQSKRERTLIDLRESMLKTNAQEPSEGPIVNLIDNNFSTYFHTLWSSASEGGKPHYLQINLDEPLSIFSIDYYGRDGGGGNGDVKRAGIWVSDTGGDTDEEWEKVSTITYSMNTPKNELFSMTEGAIILEKEYRHIRFIPEARRNADPIISSGTQGFWNMGEIYLYSISE